MANHPWRRGNVLHIPAGKEILATGDLHGHRNNLHAILQYADLPAHPQRCLILQEIIHGQEDPDTGQDRSLEPMMRAVRAMIQHPQQVLMLMGNHDIAEITDREITKHGRGACKTFRAGVEYEFQEQAPAVLEALGRLLLSLPLAARSPGGVFFSHSLPAPNRISPGVLEILDREIVENDLIRPGAVYEWTWGRNQTPEQIEEIAGRLDVDYFVLGHKHVSGGWEKLSDRALVLNSGDNNGGILIISSDASLTDEAVGSHLKRIYNLNESEPRA